MAPGSARSSRRSGSFPGFSRVARGGVAWLPQLDPDRRPGTTHRPQASLIESDPARTGIAPLAPFPTQISRESEPLEGALRRKEAPEAWQSRQSEAPGRGSRSRLLDRTIRSRMAGAGAERSGQVTSQPQGLTAPFFRPTSHGLQVLAPSRQGPSALVGRAGLTQRGAIAMLPGGTRSARNVAAGRSLSKPESTRERACLLSARGPGRDDHRREDVGIDPDDRPDDQGQRRCCARRPRGAGRLRGPPRRWRRRPRRSTGRRSSCPSRRPVEFAEAIRIGFEPELHAR